MSVVIADRATTTIQNFEKKAHYHESTNKYSILSKHFRAGKSITCAVTTEKKENTYKQMPKTPSRELGCIKKVRPAKSQTALSPMHPAA
jgi:hypothetical protein